jgi:hypothetical protein
VIRSFTDAMAASVIAEKESFLRGLLDKHIPGWTLEDVPRRCKWIRYAGKAQEELHIDGKPVLEMWPIEFENFQEGNAYKIRATWKYRELSPLWSCERFHDPQPDSLGPRKCDPCDTKDRTECHNRRFDYCPCPCHKSAKTVLDNQ